MIMAWDRPANKFKTSIGLRDYGIRFTTDEQGDPEFIYFTVLIDVNDQDGARMYQKRFDMKNVADPAFITAMQSMDQAVLTKARTELLDP